MFCNVKFCTYGRDVFAWDWIYFCIKKCALYSEKSDASYFTLYITFVFILLFFVPCIKKKRVMDVLLCIDKFSCDKE